MFNATLAGHHLRPEYNSSRGNSRQGSRFDINEVGRHQQGGYSQQSSYYVPPHQLAERITMLDDVECQGSQTKSCYSQYKTCCYLTLVFSIIATTIVIIIYVALGGLRGGSGPGLGSM